MTETNSEFTISRAYEDHRDLLTQIKTEVPDGGGGTNVVSQYDYAYDAIGLRSSVVTDGTAFGTNAEHNIWGYNERGELTSSYRYVGSNPSTTTNEVTVERRLYVYDPIGNRQGAYVGSSLTPNPAYTRNNLNQYTATVNPSESFTYDEDGNMTEDGTFDYTWNGENRLIQVEPSTATTNDLRLTFAYPVIPPGRRETGLRDHPPSPRWLRRTGMGRRVQKVVETYDGSSWSTNAVTKFVWEGWLLIAELDGLDSDALTRTHTWGLDLSGTFTGAGGIGGLLMVDDDTGDGFCGYFAYDGNGNVGQVLDAEDLSTDAHYEYDPYGRQIVATGTYADDNPWRFSTKWLDVIDPSDDDASLLYYGFRQLTPRLGRWTGRDPSGEMDTASLYAFVENGPTVAFDALGLYKVREAPVDRDIKALLHYGGIGLTRAVLYVEHPLSVKFDAETCCCYVDHPETRVLDITVYLPSLGSTALRAWTTEATRRGVRRHEGKHVRIWKHYGKVWDVYERWQKSQSAWGLTESDCKPKLIAHILACRDQAMSFFRTRAGTANNALDAEEDYRIVSGWVPVNWITGSGWKKRRARVFDTTGNWRMDLGDIELNCPNMGCTD